ncbi:MAG: hypothetical protein GQ583_03985 [Methyloprofundus sp.]|nr:hypothetical protein [Methyloprofundus sp.]
MNDSGEKVHCSNCHSEQDQSHLYCSNCGYILHQSDVKRQPNINAEQQVENIINAIKKQAHTVELETLEKIQDHATRWAKTNLFFIGLASSVLILSLSFFGYKQVADLERQAIETELLEKQARDRTNVVIMQADSSLAKIKELDKKIEDKGIQKNIDRIYELKIQMDKKIRMAEKILKQVTAERQNVQKVQHSFFSISMQFDGSKEQLNEHRSSLIKAMNKKGFQLTRANILEIGVNQTEVLYYNEIAAKQAELIAKIARESLQLPRMESRLISMFDRNPREILVKIKFP